MNFVMPLIYGFLAATGSLFLESLFLLILYPENDLYAMNISSVPSNPLCMIILAVLTEELFKLIFIKKIYYDLEIKKGIIFSSFLLGIGFSSIEFMLNLFHGNFWQNLSNWYLWGVVLIHIFTSMLIGFFFFWKKSDNHWFIATVFSAACIFHLTYNLSVIFLFK